MESAEALSPDPSRAPDRGYALSMLCFAWMPGVALVLFGGGRWLLGPTALRPDGHLMLLGWCWAYLALLGWLVTSARGSGLSLAATLGPRPRVAWLPECGLVAWLHLQLNGSLFLLLIAVLHAWLPTFAQRLGNAGTQGLGLEHIPIAFQWLLIVGLAPITEEWLFRGVLYHRFARRFGPARSQLLTSALFALLHMNPFGVFALGMLLQALLQRTRSLRTCMLAHAINNAVPLALLTWSGGTPLGEGVRRAELDRIAHAWPAWAVMSAALIGLLVWHLRGRWPNSGEPTPWAAAAAAIARPVPAA